MTKLILTALMFCSSLALAADAPSTAPKKKMSKLVAPSTESSAQKVDETVFGGLGTGSLSTTAPKKSAAMPRGTAPAPRK